MEGSLQWHPGHGESPEHANQLRQLAVDRALPFATALCEVPCRRDVASPDKERDKDQGTGCQHGAKTCDQPADECAHQPDNAEFDSIDSIRIDAGLDQKDRIEARRTEVKAAAPEHGNGTEPSLVPSLPPSLMLAPLNWRQGRGTDQRDTRCMQWSGAAEHSLQSGKAR